MSGASTAGRRITGAVHDVVADPVTGLEVETPMPWVRVLRTRGELGSAAAARLIDCVRTQLDAGAEHIVLDLSTVDLLTPAGLTAVVEAREATSAAGSDLHLAGVLRPEVIRPVQDRWQPEEFRTHRTTIEALAAISEWPHDWGVPLPR